MVQRARVRPKRTGVEPWVAMESASGLVSPLVRPGVSRSKVGWHCLFLSSIAGTLSQVLRNRLMLSLSSQVAPLKGKAPTALASASLAAGFSEAAWGRTVLSDVPHSQSFCIE